MVLIHGFPESWYSWRHQLTALAAAGYKAVAIDQRGYGQSSKPTTDAEHRPYSKRTSAQDVLRLLRALGQAEHIPSSRTRALFPWTSTSSMSPPSACIRGRTRSRTDSTRALDNIGRSPLSE